MSSQSPGALRRFWNTLRRPSAKYSILALLVVGFIAGIVFWGGFNTGLEATNTKAFCIGCHEMHDNVYQEYVGTVHDTNRTGVRAICSDCHVPKDWLHKMARKIQASNEVYHKLMGTVGTKAKFEAHRMELATHVWKVMKESNSRECRNCHSFEAMDSSKQSPRAQKNHADAQVQGKTCIDCHKGIAHLLPKEYNEDEELLSSNSDQPIVVAGGAGTVDVVAGKKLSAICVNCHGPEGVSATAMFPNLACKKQSYLAGALTEFQSGKRVNPVMVGIAKGLSTADVQNVAAYFSGVSCK